MAKKFRKRTPEEKAEYQTPYAKAELLPLRPIRPGDEITSVVTLEEKERNP